MDPTAEVQDRSPSGREAPRATVFIDYQNMYRSSREAFGWAAQAGRYGNFRPYSLARAIVNRLGASLEEVRIYTGVHTPQRNATEHAHMQRRLASWIAAAPHTVQVFPRSLAYRRVRGTVVPQEKGVDVELAVDLVALGIEGAYDIAVLGSADTDLIPAARYALEGPGKRVVCVGLQADTGCQPPQPLDLDHASASRFFVQRELFERVAERTDFYDSHNDQHGTIPQDRWVAVQARLGRR